MDAAGYAKVDEIPYDFLRKRLSILVAHDASHRLITKGALDNVLAVCAQAAGADGVAVALAKVRDDIERQHKELGGQGYRRLGVSLKMITGDNRLVAAHVAHRLAWRWIGCCGGASCG